MSVPNMIRRWRWKRKMRKISNVYYRNNKEACDRAQKEFDMKIFKALSVNYEDC